jgi:hypothetical protein
MDRRDFIKVSTSSVIGMGLPVPFLYNTSKSPVHAGWIPDQRALDVVIRHTVKPYLTQQTTRSFQGSGTGKVVLLHKYLEKAIGKIIPHEQLIGDCVGQAYALGVDVLTATQIHHLGLAERWITKSSSEAMYAGSRYEIGYKVHNTRGLLNGDGSLGVYCAEYLRDYGVLLRQKYGDFDLTQYDARLARTWGRTGVPDELEPLAKEHPVRSTALVRSYEEARDAIANGYPVIFCSGVGFDPNRGNNDGGRDSMGFLSQGGAWYHSMCAIAVDDTDRPGVLIINSWGPDWVTGAKRHGQPDGSFWVDAATIDEMCGAGDSHAISGFIGFPSQRLDYNLF